MTASKTAIFMAATALATAAHAAEDYPVRPIHYVVPFSAGGPPDLLSRAIAERISVDWGQPVVVDNRPGAAGNLGAELVAKATPDGYTVMTAHIGTHAISAALYPKLPFDPVHDFTPITLIATLPLALLVHPSLPARSVKELIALAKKEPGEIRFASAGTGGPTHLAGELFKTMTKVNIVHVPYKGNAAALTELVDGHVQMMFSNLLASLPYVRAGKLRALAVTTTRRSPQAPELPALSEAGVYGYDVTPWYGILGPAHMPRPIVMKWNAEIARIVRLPEMQQRFVQQGVDLTSTTPEEFAALIKTEIPRWSRIVMHAGTKVD